MVDLAAVVPVTDRERRRAERLTALGCLLLGALLAILHLAVTAALGVTNRPDALPVAIIAYTLAIGGWVVNSGRALGHLGNPRNLSFKARVAYRGARLSAPAMTVATFGLLLTPVWDEGSYVLMVAGLAGSAFAVFAGVTGRVPWLSPRPLREGWPEMGTGPLPHLYPGFVAHVVWLRRLRAAVLGGDASRPLV